MEIGMFNTQQFGKYVAEKRKSLDMTQSALADMLNVTRQAVSRYEIGDSFPDITILVSMAEIFGITLDELILSGGATMKETKILGDAARGVITDGGNIDDIVGIAPLLRPSVLSKLAERYSAEGIDISSLVTLSEFLGGSTVADLMEKVNYENIDEDILSRFLPILDNASKYAVFEKILEGKLSYQFIKKLLPYTPHLMCHMEAAVIDGALPADVLKYIGEFVSNNA